MKLDLLRRKRFLSQPTQWARGGGSTDFVRGGGDASPRNMSDVERERVESLERMSVFAGNARHHAYPNAKS